MQAESPIVPVVLAGGTGSRLWPSSRQQYPKQFLPLTDPQRSMLQCTLDRLARLTGIKSQSPLVVCNAMHRFIAAEQVQSSAWPQTRILLEPVGKGTAAAACFACLHALTADPEAVVVLMPSDHHLEEGQAFETAVARAVLLAQQGFLVTFGVAPTHPQTGYGYIEVGDSIDDVGVRVRSFTEKPSLDRARDFLATGQHFWNSGMLVFKAAVMLHALEQWAPDVLQACRQAWAGAERDLDFLRLPGAALITCPDLSIDCAVMEKTTDAAMVRLDAQWSDVGSWSALKELWPSDAHGNSLRGDVVALDSTNCLVRSESRLVALLGVDELLVVDTPDALLVTHSSRAQEVKTLVNQLSADKRSEADAHRRVFRPWGSYEGIGQGNRYQVKRIVVEPGQALSLQLHHHRAEHWIVVRGTARVVKGDQAFLLSENQSTYIPVGEQHSLENPGVIPLEMIEVQSGAYLGEDDIVRFSDRYGRAAA